MHSSWRAVICCPKPPKARTMNACVFFFSKKEHWTPACEDEFFTLSASRYSEDTVLWCEGVRAVATRAREGYALARRVCLLSLAPAPLAQLHRPCSARLLLSAALCSCCATAASSSPAVVFFPLSESRRVEEQAKTAEVRCWTVLFEENPLLGCSSHSGVPGPGPWHNVNTHGNMNM